MIDDREQLIVKTENIECIKQDDKMRIPLIVSNDFCVKQEVATIEEYTKDRCIGRSLESVIVYQELTSTNSENQSNKESVVEISNVNNKCIKRDVKMEFPTFSNDKFQVNEYVKFNSTCNSVSLGPTNISRKSISVKAELESIDLISDEDETSVLEIDSETVSRSRCTSTKLGVIKSYVRNLFPGQMNNLDHLNKDEKFLLNLSEGVLKDNVNKKINDVKSYAEDTECAMGKVKDEFPSLINCEVDIKEEVDDHNEDTFNSLYPEQVASTSKKFPENTNILQNLYKCRYCQYETGSQKQLARHNIRTHHSKPKCKFCSYEGTPGAVKIHENAIHTQEHVYSCRYCQYGTFYRCTLLKHIRLRHTEKSQERIEREYNTESIQLFKCKICNFRAGNKIEVRNHEMALHMENDLYCCPYCEHKTNNTTNMRIHINVHTQ